MEGALQLDDPVILSERQYVSLGPHVSDLVLIDHLGLFHLFDRDYFPGFFVATDSHLTEGTSADDLKGFEVSNGDFGS